MNPFLSTYKTPFETIPFSKINNEHYLPALKKGIELTQAEIQNIISNPQPPTFQNTIEVMEKTGDIINKVTAAFFNLNAANTNDEMQSLAQGISPLLTAHGNDIMMNKELFDRIKVVYESGIEGLTTEQETLLTKTYKSFVRNGANLGENEKNRLREIDTLTAKLSLTFGEHVLKESNQFKLVLDNQKNLSGLPQSVIEAASITAKNEGYENKWVFTLDYPSYIPFMTYAENRSLREQMYRAFNSKGFQDNDNNNTAVVRKITKLRAERAQLLGYESHAHYVLEERMAESPSKVLDFLNDIQSKAIRHAKNEFDELTAYAHQLDQIKQIQKWDGIYYSEKLKKEKFAIDDELLRPYFQLENVVNGVFKTAQKLFGITFKQRNDIDVYHEDVITYEVLSDKNEHLAVFYADFFPRPGKRQGAWMTSFRSQKIEDNRNIRPHVSIVCNFTKPTDELPSLLSFQEVTTLFHEFGHALHGIFANGNYASLSGTSVFWDFVELPSQLLENWCYEKECLNLFAKHHQTNEVIPLDYVQKIKNSSNFQAGMATLRQIGLGKIDMGWHAITLDNAETLENDFIAFESSQLNGIDLYPSVDGCCISTSFSHIFQGGYSSGYYSYKWAEVLEADAFEAFKEMGIFNSKVAHKFRDHILSSGGSEHPSLLYRKFRGKDATIDALLNRAGLIQDQKINSKS
ncbi:MAG: M3 family metallopeptidase [Bacteroidia bacterium]|nr:M3 family metallopeptidase [Bacteroidia bacterium]